MCDTLIWALVKTGLAIVASSAATLRPLFREMKKHKWVGGRFVPAEDSLPAASRKKYTHPTPGSTWELKRTSSNLPDEHVWVPKKQYAIEEKDGPVDA